MITFLFSFLLLVSNTCCAEERFVETNSAKIYCHSVGTGKPVIVLHGGPGLSQGYLLPAMEELAKENHVIFYDQRGGGNSLGPIDTSTIQVDNFTQDIEAIRKAYGYEKISIIGHSWGGHLAMKYAISYPDHMENLILVSSTAATSEDFQLFMKEWVKRMGPYMQELHTIEETAAYKAGDPEAVAKTFRMMFRTYCAHPEDADKLALTMSSQANIRGKQTYKILAETYILKPFDLTSELQKLKCKTLIIHGDADPVPLESAKTIQKSVPGAHLVLLENCGHFPYVEKPEPFFTCIKNFLNPTGH